MSAFEITYPAQGAVCRGSLVVVVQCLHPYEASSTTRFMIDQIDLGRTWTINGVSYLGVSANEDHTNSLSPESGTLEFCLMTNLWSNGSHVFSVIDDKNSHRVSVNVEFDNCISAVNAEGVIVLSGEMYIDSKPDADISAVITPDQDWSLEICDTARWFFGRGSQIDIMWDGLDADGNPVDEDSYFVNISAVESGENILTGPIIVFR